MSVTRKNQNESLTKKLNRNLTWFLFAIVEASRRTSKECNSTQTNDNFIVDENNNELIMIEIEQESLRIKQVCLQTTSIVHKPRVSECVVKWKIRELRNERLKLSNDTNCQVTNANKFHKNFRFHPRWLKYYDTIFAFVWVTTFRSTLVLQQVNESSKLTQFDKNESRRIWVSCESRYECSW